MRLTFSFFSILLFCSCTNNQLAKDVAQFMGQQITLPLDMHTILKGKDTVLTGFTEIPIKLLVWYDPFVCASCQVSKMYEWNDIVFSADSLSQWFKIVFLFTPKQEDLHTIKVSLRADRFNYPIFIDQNATFVNQNPKLPKNRLLHCFLLDRNNKVVLVGSPLHNPVLWEFYNNIIQKMIDNNGVLP